MDLFDTNRDFLGAFLKSKDKPPERECNAPQVFSQKDLLLNFAKKITQNRNINPKEKTLQITHCDERIAEHLKKNGWDHSSQVLWEKSGFHLIPAQDRIKTLQKSGLLSKDFASTPKLDLELKQLKAKLKERTVQRFCMFREQNKTKSINLFQKLSLGQQQVIATLGTFRQMTPAQAKHLGTSANELKTLREQGIIEHHHVLCDQRPMQLYSLTKNNGRNPSGKDLAHYGAGIEKPATGIQRDHSKILHDVSVIDAVREAKSRFLGKGYEHIATISEHQMYQTKTSANSDTKQRYADAYLIVRSAGGDEETVAVEFGNYAPSYMKEKMQGIDADHRLIYTHDANRADEYSQALANLPGNEIEIDVIPTPHMEVER